MRRLPENRLIIALRLEARQPDRVNATGRGRSASGCGGEACEPELCRRIVAAGGRLLYVPDAVVDHLVPATRLTEAYLAQRFFYQGVTEAFTDIRFAGVRAAWTRVGRGLRHRAAGVSWDGVANAEGNAMLERCRRRQSLGYAAGCVVGLLRYRALRRLAA